MAEGDQFLFLGDWPIVLQGTVVLLYAQVVALELWDGRQQRRVCFRDDDPTGGNSTWGCRMTYLILIFLYFVSSTTEKQACSTPTFNWLCRLRRSGSRNWAR